METKKKTKIFVVSFLLSEIFAVISIATFLFYLNMERNLEFFTLNQAKPIPLFIELIITGGFFLTSLFFFIDVMRHPAPERMT